MRAGKKEDFEPKAGPLGEAARRRWVTIDGGGGGGQERWARRVLGWLGLTLDWLGEVEGRDAGLEVLESVVGTSTDFVKSKSSLKGDGEEVGAITMGG